MFNTKDKESLRDDAAGGKSHHDMNLAYIKEELLIDFNEPSYEISFSRNSIKSASDSKIREIVGNVNAEVFTSEQYSNILGDEKSSNHELNINVSHNNEGLIVPKLEQNLARNEKSYNCDSNSNTLDAGEIVNTTIAATDQKRQKNNVLLKLKIMKKRAKRNYIRNFLRIHCERCYKSSTDIPKNKFITCEKCKNFMKFQCIKCKRLYNSYSSLYQHVRHNCSHQSVFKCSQCVYKTWDRRCLNGHVKRRHEIKKCIKCGKKFKYYLSLKKHEKNECEFKTLEAKKRGRPKSLPEKSDHTNKLNLVEYYCAQCQEIVPKSDLMITKICEVCNSSLKMYCTKCEKQFETDIPIDYHLINQCEDRKFHCAECEYKTVLKGNLLVHITNKHMPRKCNKCGEQCSDYTALRMHKISHNKSSKKAKPLVRMHCPNCKKTSDKDLNIKMKNCQECSTSLQYECLECPNKYDTWDGFKTHRKFHRKRERLQNCSICDYVTTVKGLKKHIAYEHVVRICKKCGVKCENYNGLKFHQSNECNMRKQTTVNRCTLCNYSTYKGTLKNHNKYYHTSRTCGSCKVKFENYFTFREHRLSGCRYVAFKRKKPRKEVLKVYVNCHVCNRSVTSAMLEMHIAYQHIVRICPYCQKKCDNYQSLKVHQSSECSFREQEQLFDGEENQINLYCPKCLTTIKFVDEGSRERKCSVCQTELKFECKVCLKLFQRYKFIRHHQLKICNKEAEVLCPIPGCNFKTKEKTRITYHVRKRHTIRIAGNISGNTIM